MNSAAAEMEGKMIAASVATRQKALSVLKQSRRPSFVSTWAPTLVAIVLGGSGLSALDLPLWPKIMLSVACTLAFASVAFAWRVQRQLMALTDLLLLNEEQKRD
ncbi:MAG TPA: hypothetical protein VFS47_00315 [Steroidobacteraceae bacterium]|jgi:hypothetical protein|nr:hypothetical protein [Steroidobacteraceae bacterium]